MSSPGIIRAERVSKMQAKRNAAPVVTHGKRQSKKTNLIIQAAQEICNQISAGFLGAAMAAVICGDGLMFLLMLAVSVLLAMAAEVQK